MTETDLKPTTPKAQAGGRPRRQSKRGLETERKLLAAANEVFWANGFGNTTIMQIIEASGLSVGSFYHRFADKEDLLEEATRNVFFDFQTSLSEADFSRDANGDLYTLFYRLTLRGRDIVSAHRGIYRAMTEMVQTDFDRFGTLARITPILIARIEAEIGVYTDQMQAEPDQASIAAAVQLVTMTVMQTELGLGPAFPQEIDAFARIIARGSCGILGYTGQTDGPTIGVSA